MSFPDASRIEIRKPDDFHLHVRDGEILNLVISHTASQFARAVIMPNLAVPVKTPGDAEDYKSRILKALPAGISFTPLMTLYLTGDTTKEDIRTAKESGEIIGIKLYPAGATTNSSYGVTDIFQMKDIFCVMEKFEIPLLIHGEVADTEVDIFDRERVFIEKYLTWMMKNFPALQIVLEHVSTSEGVDFVMQSSEKIAATITPHHLILTRNDIFSGGLRPHHYCLPVVKTSRDRESLLKAAVSGNPKFFAGTDSAPHPVAKKESSCCSAGIYNAHDALSFYTEVFEKQDALDKLEDFTSRFGAEFYGLELNSDRIVLEKKQTGIPDSFSLKNDRIIPFRAGESVGWRVV